MPKTDNVRQVDLPRSGSGGSVYIRGGNAGGVSNADTVDGYHASSTPTAGKLLALDASAQFAPSVIEWADVAGAGLGASGDTLVVLWGDTPTTIQPDDVAAGGSAAASARSDHRHAIATAVPGTILPDDSANEGSATSFARSDHRHAITAAAPAANLSASTSNAEGSASSFSRSDHSHAITSYSDASVYPGHLVKSDASGDLKVRRLEASDRLIASLVTSAAGTGLTVQPDGDLILVPGSSLAKVSSGVRLQSDGYVSQTTGWGVSHAGAADFRYLYVDEMHAKAFVADLEQALAGGQIISKSVAILAADFTMPAKGTTAYFYVEDLPGTTAAVFQNADWVRIRNISRAGGGLVVADAYGQVDGYAPQGNGTQRWRFIRPAGDTGSALPGAVVKKGGLALDYGVSGNGFWEVTTLDPAGSPYAQVATWATHPQNLTVRVRLGNLDGIAGIGAEWGFWAGTDVNHQFKASSAGVELRGIPQYWIDASNNTRGQVDPTATGTNTLFWLGPSSGDPRFAVRADGVVLFGAVNSTSVAGWAHASDLTKIDGGDIYAGSVTAPALNVHGVNWLSNPGFEDGVWGGWVPAGANATLQESESGSHTGTRYMIGTGSGINHTVVTQTFRVLGGRNYYLGVWARNGSGVTGSSGCYVWWKDGAGNSLGYGNAFSAASTSWTKKELIATAPDTAQTAMFCLTIREDTTGNVAFDDAEFYAADGQVLVGTPAGARVEINSAGVEGYSDASTRQFYLDATTGRGTFGEGKGILDRTGLMLSGSETSYQTYNALRWLDGTLPSGDELARVSAGLFVRDDGNTADVPALRIVSNPAGTYGASELELSNQALTDTPRQRLLLFNATESDVEGMYHSGIKLEVINTPASSKSNAMLYITCGPGDFSAAAQVACVIDNTTRFVVNASGAIATRFASYTSVFTGTAGTHSLYAPGNGIYLLSAAADDNNWRLIEYLRVRGTTVSSIANVVSNYLSLTSSGGIIQIANSNAIAQTVRWCLIRLAN